MRFALLALLASLSLAVAAPSHNGDLLVERDDNSAPSAVASADSSAAPSAAPSPSSCPASKKASLNLHKGDPMNTYHLKDCLQATADFSKNDECRKLSRLHEYPGDDSSKLNKCTHEYHKVMGICNRAFEGIVWA